MKVYNIDNSLIVIASDWTSKKGIKGASLELRGQFASKSLNIEYVRDILNNRALTEKAIKYLATGALETEIFQIGEFVLSASNWKGNMMLEIVTGKNAYYNPRFSVNVANVILGHEKELRAIVSECTPAQLQEEETKKAQKEMKKSSVNLPTDKKTPHDSKVLENAPALSNGVLTIEKWLARDWKMNETDAAFYALDVDAQKAYAEYVKVNARPTFAQIQAEKAKNAPKESFKDIQAKKNGASANSPETTKAIQNFERETGQKFELPKGKASRAIPLRFTIRLAHNDKITEQTLMAKSKKSAYNELLKDMRLAHPTERDDKGLPVTKLITYGDDNGSHYFDARVNEGFIYNVKKG